MKQLTHIFLFLFLALHLASCGTKDLNDYTDDGATKLTGSAISDLLSGNTVKATGYGQIAEIIFHQNFKISATNSSNEKDTGNWKITDTDMLCMRFYQWGEKQAICYLAYQAEKEILLFNKRGIQLYSFTIIDKSTDATTEGITHSSSQPPSTKGQNQVAQRDIPKSSAPPFTKKTAKDVEFFIRQSAQNCPGCNLSKANLSGQILIGANMEGTNLTEANLSKTVLRRANLRGAILYKANLQNANLMGADLTGADLTGAILTGAHTQGAIGYAP